MARSEFSVFSRKGKNGKITFCVRFFDGIGRVKKTVSLPQARSRTAAGRLVEKLMEGGVVPNALNPDLVPYLLDFWKPDSAYVESRALRGHVLSSEYIKNSRYAIKKHFSGCLAGLRILDLTPAVLESAVLDLSRSGASARRINIVLQAVKVPYGNFCRMNRIVNVLQSVEKLRENPRERGVLTLAEVAAIVALEGESPRVKAAVLLGCLCGLRLGEVRGLQWTDIDDGIIHVTHNFVPGDDLKGPKCGSVRDVPVPRPVQDALDTCQATRPAKAGLYVLCNETRRGKPVPGVSIRNGFHRMLAAIGIGEAERKARNLLFHGLRHTFVSLSRSAGVPDFVVQSMAGHSDMAMTDRYSHVGILDFQKARAAMESAVSGKTASV